MMGESGDGFSAYVVTLEAVRASIAALRTRLVHPYFPAYLHLRRQAAKQGTQKAIRPKWSELGRFLEVPGGPQPHYRPFWAERADAGQEWLNRNLAGSFAPSSLRDVPRRVVDTDGDRRFLLRERHWERARQHLAYGQRIPVLALAGYFLRNHALLAPSTPGRDDLVRVFLTEFGYRSPEDDDEVAHLYQQEWRGPERWFEEFDDGVEQ